MQGSNPMRLDHLDQTAKPAQYVAHHNDSFTADDSNSQRNLLQYWPQWRGPLATGEAPLGNPPTEWNEEHNIGWKTRLPGSGHSTPIIWEDHIFITATEPHGDKLGPPPPQPTGAHNNKDAIRKHNFIVLAVSRSTGEFLWKKIVRHARPNGSTHETGTWASPQQ